MRTLWIGLAALGVTMTAGDRAVAGDLIPGGWLQRPVIRSAPPPPRPPQPPAEATAPEPAPKPHRAASHRRPHTAPRQHQATSPAPPNDGLVRF